MAEQVPPKVVVLGMMSKIPVAGVIWQTLHYLSGFERLGLEAYYVEAHARTPSMLMTNDDDDSATLAADFIGDVLTRHGLGNRWAFQALHADTRCFGLSESALAALYRDAALIINLHGGTQPLHEHTATGRLVYLETDPVQPQIELFEQVPETIDFLDQHCAYFTFAENYGDPGCTLPLTDRYTFHPTRQPVVLDWWETGQAPSDGPFTTIANWHQPWRNVSYDGRVYGWSKDEQFRPVIDLPGATSAHLEIALSNCREEDQATLKEHGWHLRSAQELSDLDSYRGFIQGSRGEFSVAKEQNVAFRTGWFSDRSATYLAAGRPVIMQDTGFGEALPTGCGLLPFSTRDEAAEALEAVRADYDSHAAGARRLARSHFSHEVVLGALLDTLDVPFRRSNRMPRQSFGVRSGDDPRTLGDSLVVSPVSKRPLCLAPATVDALARRREGGICVSGFPTGGRPEVSIVVPVHNRVDLTQLCLESMIGAQHPLAYEITVVDDGSTDDTSAYLGMLTAAHPHLKVVRNAERLGFAVSVNRGLAQSLGRVVVVANNDTIVGPGWMAGLVAHLDDPAVGMVVASTAAHARNCRVPAEYRTFGELQCLAEERLATDAGSRVVTMAPLFFAALRRDVLEEIGPLDERFTIGMFEDDDYCARLGKAGYLTVCALDVFVHHFGEGTLGQLYRDGEFHEIFRANRARFERKWNVLWRPTEDHDDPTYSAEVDAVRTLLGAAIPAGDVVAVVSNGDDAFVELDGPVGWHLPRTETGAHPGAHPSDGIDSIAQVEAARDAGAGWLFLPRQSGWWLDHYDGLEAHLTSHARLVQDDQAGRLYQLDRPADREEDDRDATVSATASACTIISRNYLGQARVLAHSYLDHHPQGSFYLLILDGLPAGEEIDERILLVDLGDLPLYDLGDMCFKYDVIELATAVKPALLMLLTERFTEQRIMYIDPDILITRPLVEVFEALDQADIVLTPHLNAPIPLDGHTPREQDILISGAYNLGFIAIRKSSETARLLGWWRERLNDLCRVDPANGLMVDQRWIDLVPSLFPSTQILHDDTYNVAYWNLHARHIERNGDTFTVNDRPLALFHFSGYDPEHPDRISKHQTRTELVPGSDLRALFDLYGQAMLEAGFLESKQWGYGLATFDNGIGLHTIFRRLYRDLGDDRRRFGDPLAARGEDSFYAWATRTDPARRNLSPFLEMAYRLRYDIQGAFPDVSGVDRAAFLAWAAGQGALEFGYEPEVAARCEAIAPAALPAGPAPAPQLSVGTPSTISTVDVGTRPGVNVCGYLRNESGLGAAARAYIHILEHLDVPLALLDVSDLSVNRSEDPTIGSFHDDHSYPVNLVCINADQHFVVMNKNPEFFAGKYNIGVWFWELPSFPAEWHDRFAHYDEIWVGSSYIANTLTPVSPIPVVRIMPVLGSQPPGDRTRGRSVIGASDEFVFLFMFDFNSYLERKNPLAVIEAFRMAFPTAERVRLVIKSVNGLSHTAGLAALEAAAGGDDRIMLLNDYVSAGEIQDLTAASDCYVSLHRAEGSGLTMAHAMAAGKPVIATGWSGNTDFMDSSNSLLVRFDLVELERDVGPYKLGGIWADPDVVHASALMRHLVDNPDEAVALGAAAEQSISTRFSADQVGRAAAERLGVIAQRLGRTARPEVPVSPEHGGNAALMSAIRHIVEREVSDDRPVAVISKGDPVLIDLGSRPAWHYPQNEDGVYAGYYPNDSAAAITHLEQLRARGAGHFLVPATCGWWLDHYRELRHHLDSHYVRVAEDASCVLYRLDPVAGTIEPGRPDDVSAQLDHVNATLAATGEWVADLAPRVAAAQQHIEALPEILRTAFSTVAETVVDVEAGLDGRIEAIERSREGLSGELATTRAVLDEFARHVEASGNRSEARQGQLVAELDRRLDELATHSGDQVGRLGAHVAELTAQVTSIHSERTNGLRSTTGTPPGAGPLVDQHLGELGASSRAGTSMELSPAHSEGPDWAETLTHFERRFAARPYTSTDRFGSAHPDQPLGFSRSDGGEDERVARPTFADVFRGEASFISERQRVYLPFFTGCDRVVDLGSGRGEFLDLLAESGITAEGVELDGSLVRACRRRGRTVRERDALAFLGEVEPASLDGVFSAQFIEHVDPARLGELVMLTRRALREGGLFIAETVNPENFEAFKTFHVDLTHQRPIFPHVLLQLCWEAGFEAAWIFYPLGGGFSQRGFDAVGEYAVVASA